MSMRYLVAKYVSNLVRMEPRNIGVFLPSGEHIHARFFGEEPDRGVDLRRARRIVSHGGSYKQWVEYWRYIIEGEGDVEQKLNSLIESSKGNYSVSEGQAIFLDGRAAADPYRTLEHLFYLLVTEFPEQGVEEMTLIQKIEEVIKKFNLRRNRYFQDSPVVPCQINGVIEHVRPTYGYVNGRQIYFQKVSIVPTRAELTQKDVHNAAWIFERLKADDRKRETQALIRVVRSESDEGAETVDEYLALLARLSDRVIDVDKQNEIEATFAALAE